MAESSRALRWAELTAPEVRTLAAEGAVAIWPIGSTEQHGPHLVTSFDLVGAAAVGERAAALLAPRAVLLPGLALGSSDHWLALGATLSLRPETLAAVVADVARSVGDAGFAHLVIVNGHAGNVGPALQALGAPRERPLVEFVSYWALPDAVELAAVCRADGGGIGHAGEVETSIALYLDAALVREERIADGVGVPLGGDRPGSRAPAFLRAPRPSEESPGGVYGDPRPASPELGRLVVEQAALRLADHCRSLAPPA